MKACKLGLTKYKKRKRKQRKKGFPDNWLFANRNLSLITPQSWCFMDNIIIKLFFLNIIHHFQPRNLLTNHWKSAPTVSHCESSSLFKLNYITPSPLSLLTSSPPYHPHTSSNPFARKTNYKLKVYNTPPPLPLKKRRKQNKNKNKNKKKTGKKRNETNHRIAINYDFHDRVNTIMGQGKTDKYLTISRVAAN